MTIIYWDESMCADIVASMQTLGIKFSVKPQNDNCQVS